MMRRLIIGLACVLFSGCQAVVPLYVWSSEDYPEPKQVTSTAKPEPRAEIEEEEVYSYGSVCVRDESITPIELPQAPPRQNVRRWTNGREKEMSPRLANVVTRSVEASAANMQSAVTGLANIAAQQE